ncbi:MAG: serine/threonine-protein kinase [Bacteroidota bacterium]
MRSDPSSGSGRRPRLIRARAEADEPRLPLLPRDLLARAATRLGNAALVYGCGYLLALAAAEYNFHVLGGMPWDGWDKGYTVAGFSIAAGVAMFAITRVRRIPPGTVLHLGLVFEVVAAFGITIGTVADTVWPVPFRNYGIPWTCAWILFFPFVAPARPGLAAAAAYSSAFMGPLGLATWQWMNGLPMPSAQVFAWLTIPPLICAGVATFGSQVVHALGVRLGREQALGAYLLEERIGEGGMGEIWRASHRALASPAAVKIVRHERLDDPKTARAALADFYEEAYATARLTSPHTVRLYHYGVHDDGTVYFVMELLDGMNLETLVREHGAVPPERAAHFLVQACQSLAEAHGAGLVHRDVKPANLFVCRQGLERDFLKVLDFGLVRPDPARAGAAGATSLTMTDHLVGTPVTVAPERVSGRRATAASDIYSLGCVGYWLITGRTVFDAGTPLDALLAHVRESAIRPCDRIGRPIHAGLEEILMRCLEKDPACRPVSAAALGAALETLRFEEAWTAERAQAWWKERDATSATTVPLPG